ncbi:hypothetical protein J6590_041693 [Homalodisca vitripennis]|nr:hypothetical protein J6590_041693 [Homalodisca vitripennis]
MYHLKEDILHDGEPAHYLQNVREHLQISFPGTWICRGRPINWPPGSPDLNPSNYYLWGHYNNNHLIPKKNY